MRRTVLPALALLLLAPSLAAAEPDAPAGPGATPAAAPAARQLTVGARVGGYGFRNPGSVDDHGHVAWDDCRMNGVGVFARRPVGRFFAEAGADLYFSESFPMTQTEGAWVEDRISGILTAAVGADIVRTRRVVVNAQAGAGLELTKVAMPGPDGTHRDSRALPLGFVGFGGELRLGARTGLGMNLRTMVMGHFEHVDGWSHDHAAHTAGTDSGDMPVSPEIAAQGQFYISYRL